MAHDNFAMASKPAMHGRYYLSITKIAICRLTSMTCMLATQCYRRKEMWERLVCKWQTGWCNLACLSRSLAGSHFNASVWTWMHLSSSCWSIGQDPSYSAVHSQDLYFEVYIWTRTAYSLHTNHEVVVNLWVNNNMWWQWQRSWLQRGAYKVLNQLSKVESHFFLNLSV